MALLNEIKLRTESIIRKRIQNKTFLLWANEALEQLSEIAKVEVNPLEFTLIGSDYEYVILSDGTHLHRFEVTAYTVETIVYYDSEYNEIQKDWETVNELSTQDLIIGDITYTYIVLDVETTAGEYLALKRVFSDESSTYQYKYTDGTEYTELVLEENIAQTLNITSNSIELPTNFQEVIKAIGIKNDYAYEFFERGFGSVEITTNTNSPRQVYNSNQTDLFYVSLEESKMTFKSNLINSNSLEMEISYYAHLPQYDLTDDLADWDNLTVPLEPTYHNLVNYFCIYKYNESWKDNIAANDYLTKYLKLREEYREAVYRKHQENMGSVAEKAIRFI